MFQKTKYVAFAAFFATSAMMTSCKSSKDTIVQYNTLSKTEIKKGWKLLFDGTSTNGWHGYLKGTTVKGWTTANGVLSTPGKNGDIVTDQEFENFELVADWKITAKGNSGIFYYVVEDQANKRIHESGPEFQIIDNLNYPQKLQENQVTGSASDVLKPEMDATNPIGEWNTTKIIAKNGLVEHWLNGKKILSFDMNSDEWKEAVAKSKFAPLNYAKVFKGRIGLQDHGNFVAYRNIKIREL